MASTDATMDTAGATVGATDSGLTVKEQRIQRNLEQQENARLRKAEKQRLKEERVAAEVALRAEREKQKLAKRLEREAALQEARVAKAARKEEVQKAHLERVAAAQAAKAAKKESRRLANEARRTEERKNAAERGVKEVNVVLDTNQIAALVKEQMEKFGTVENVSFNPSGSRFCIRFADQSSAQNADSTAVTLNLTSAAVPQELDHWSLHVSSHRELKAENEDFVALSARRNKTKDALVQAFKAGGFAVRCALYKRMHFVVCFNSQDDRDKAVAAVQSGSIKLNTEALEVAPGFPPKVAGRKRKNEGATAMDTSTDKKKRV